MQIYTDFKSTELLFVILTIYGSDKYMLLICIYDINSFILQKHFVYGEALFVCNSGCFTHKFYLFAGDEICDKACQKIEP